MLAALSNVNAPTPAFVKADKLLRVPVMKLFVLPLPIVVSALLMVKALLPPATLPEILISPAELVKTSLPVNVTLPL